MTHATKRPVTIDLLPLDIIHLIVQYIPAHPRVLMASRVSKRFLKPCRGSIRYLKALRDREQTAAALEVLPSVESMGCFFFGLKEQPLLVSCSSMDVKLDTLLCDLPTLTSVNLWQLDRNATDRVLPLLSQTGLRSLMVDGCGNLGHFLRFKALTALGCSNIPAPQGADQTQELHSLFSRLQRFEIRQRTIPECVMSAHFPMLTDLLLRFVPLASIHEIALTRLAPYLTSLSISLKSAKCLSVLEQCLTHLTLLLDDSMPFEVDRKRLTLIPRLTHLITSSHAIIYQYEALTSLRYVCIYEPTFIGFQQVMPLLSSLQLLGTFQTWDDLLHIVTSTLLHCPVLRKLQIRVPHCIFPTSEDLGRLFAAAQAAGVERIALNVHRELHTNVVLVASKFPWLHVTEEWHMDRW